MCKNRFPEVVMNATRAAELCAIINLKVAVLIHCNFSGGKFKDRFILKYDGNARQFAGSAAAKAPHQLTVIPPRTR